MTARRYAVINRLRKCINIILADDPWPADYWPGYGAGLIYLGPADPNETDTPPTVPATEVSPGVWRIGGLRWLPNVHPDAPFQIGDNIVLLTGRVIKWTPTRFERDGEWFNEAPFQEWRDERNTDIE